MSVGLGLGLGQPDRWSCPEPGCRVTVVSRAQHDEDIRGEIREAQEEHGARHERERTAKVRATFREATR